MLISKSANFQNANFQKCEFSKMLILKSANFQNANFQKCEFSKVLDFTECWCNKIDVSLLHGVGFKC